MAAWLSEHPQVFISPVKEPHHFDTDHVPGIKNRKQYEALFRKADDGHVRVGEASVRYLHSRVALKSILNYSERPKFIVMVRNPIEMAPSLHEQYVFSLLENVASFEEAWKLQNVRARGEMIPKTCPDPNHLQYGDYCRLGQQVQRAMETIPNGDLMLVFMDDLITHPEKVYADVLAFIEVSSFRPSFKKLNSAKQSRSLALARATRFAVEVKERIGLGGKSFGIGSKLDQWNRIERRRAPLSAAMREELAAYFYDDIKLLERLSGRNLEPWLNGTPV